MNIFIKSQTKERLFNNPKVKKIKDNCIWVYQNKNDDEYLEYKSELGSIHRLPLHPEVLDGILSANKWISLDDDDAFYLSTIEECYDKKSKVVIL